MARSIRSSLKLFLKVVNAVFGILGLFMIGFGLWLLRVWLREVVDGSSSAPHPVPWFIYASISIGVSLCLLACVGHSAADTANGLCLSFYLVIIFALTMFEIAFAADIYVNSDWEEELPEDPTGIMDKIAKFVEKNSQAFRWLGLSIVFVQVLSIFLTVMLRNTVNLYDSDEDYMSPHLPLLQPSRHYQGEAASLSFTGDPSSATPDKAGKYKFKEGMSEYD